RRIRAERRRRGAHGGEASHRGSPREATPPRATPRRDRAWFARANLRGNHDLALDPQPRREPSREVLALARQRARGGEAVADWTDGHIQRGASSSAPSGILARPRALPIELARQRGHVPASGSDHARAHGPPGALAEGGRLTTCTPSPYRG